MIYSKMKAGKMVIRHIKKYDIISNNTNFVKIFHCEHIMSKEMFNQVDLKRQTGKSIDEL